MNRADFFKAVRELKPSQYPHYIKLNEGEYSAELRVYSPGSITEWDYMQMNRYHMPTTKPLYVEGLGNIQVMDESKWAGANKWISTYYGICGEYWGYSNTPDELAEKLVDTVDVDMAKLPEYLKNKQEERERDERRKWESYFDIVKFLLAVVIVSALFGWLINALTN